MDEHREAGLRTNECAIGAGRSAFPQVLSDCSGHEKRIALTRLPLRGQCRHCGMRHAPTSRFTLTVRRTARTPLEPSARLRPAPSSVNASGTAGERRAARSITCPVRPPRRISLGSGLLVVRLLQHAQQGMQGRQIPGSRRIDRLLQKVIARQIARIDAVHSGNPRALVVPFGQHALSVTCKPSLPARDEIRRQRRFEVDRSGNPRPRVGLGERAKEEWNVGLHETEQRVHLLE